MQDTSLLRQLYLQVYVCAKIVKNYNSDALSETANLINT